jgi:threonylcarbamoyladenosine tRNA methylthiotransferase MtaB
MSQQIEDKGKQARNQRMLELSQSSRRRFREQSVGQTMAVLWEREASPGSGIYSGLTGNYIRVLARSEKHLDNKVTPVKLVEFRNQEMWGELVNENPGQGETEFQD